MKNSNTCISPLLPLRHVSAIPSSGKYPVYRDCNNNIKAQQWWWCRRHIIIWKTISALILLYECCLFTVTEFLYHQIYFPGCFNFNSFLHSSSITRHHVMLLPAMKKKVLSIACFSMAIVPSTYIYRYIDAHFFFSRGSFYNHKNIKRFSILDSHLTIKSYIIKQYCGAFRLCLFSEINRLFRKTSPESFDEQWICLVANKNQNTMCCYSQKSSTYLHSLVVQVKLLDYLSIIDELL